MAALRYKDEHNKVGYLLKPTRSDDYHQIIDFLRASHITYALTHNPIIFDSLFKQFWSTATLRSPELGPPAIQATIDKTPYTITEDLVRSRLQLADDGAIADLPIAEIYSGMDNLSPIVVALICLSDGRRFNWSSYICKGMVSKIGNAKKFFMYPRFLQAILCIDTRIKRQYKVLMFSSKLFANMRLNFEGHPMPLLPIMLLQAQAGEGAEKVKSLETELKDHNKLFKDVVGKLVKKVKAMEVKLKTKKRKMVVSDSDQEEGEKQDVDLDALRTLANAAVTVDSNISPGGASNNPAASTSVPTVVPTGATVVPAGALTIPPGASTIPPGKSPMVEEDIPVKARTFQQMEEDRLDNFPARMAPLINRKRQALAKKLAQKRQNQPMTQVQQRTYMRQFVKNKSCAVYSTGWSMAYVKSFTDDQLKAEFEKIEKAISNIQIQAFSRTLKRTGPVLEEPSSKRQKSTEVPIPTVPDVPQSPVISSPPSSGTMMKSFGRKRLPKPKSTPQELDLDVDAQTFIKIVSTEDSDDEAPLVWSALVGWEVIPTPLGDINALYRMDRSTSYFTTLREIVHMVDREDPLKLYGLVVKYYENHPVAGARLILLYTLSNVHILEIVYGEVLSMFVDVSYPLSVKLMEKTLRHKLEIDKDVVGNDMTTAEQLIQFIKNQLAAAQVSSV
nr:xylulose kinase-1 [Tanacetum cinerariifolium]